MRTDHLIGLSFAGAIALGAGVTTVSTLLRHDTLTRVIDGDTIVINGKTHARLWGIDAPELTQTCVTEAGRIWGCGEAAARYMRELTTLRANDKFACKPIHNDHYGRMVETCTVNGHDIARSMVAAGMALDWPQWSVGAYAVDQAYAKNHKLGMWSGSFQEPWYWRRDTHACDDKSGQVRHDNGWQINCELWNHNDRRR